MVEGRHQPGSRRLVTEMWQVLAAKGRREDESAARAWWTSSRQLTRLFSSKASRLKPMHKAIYICVEVKFSSSSLVNRKRSRGEVCSLRQLD